MAVVTVTEFLEKCGVAAVGLEASVIASVRTAVGIIEAAITARAADAAGADLTLSGVNRPKGGKLNVLTEVFGNQATIAPHGPWDLVESDTRKHDIAPNSQRRRRDRSNGRFKAGATALAIDGGYFASAHDTGGSHGSHPWEEGLIAAEPLVAAAFAAKVTATLEGVFG